MFSQVTHNGVRFLFRTDDPKELTAHLETLDALQIRRPAEARRAGAVMWTGQLIFGFPVRITGVRRAD